MLVVVGTGINGPAHLTQETRAWITNADAVYYVVADAVTENYILSIAPKATNLYHHYQVGRPRIETYRDMSDDILAEVRKEKLVVAIFYGHPGVFVTPSHDVVLRAKAEGYEAKMLPAI
jgi:diphthamide biosynthesis methyltransferase